MKKILFFIIFMMLLCNSSFATLIIIDDDVLFDDDTSLYWYRNVGHFQDFTYTDIEHEIGLLCTSSGYNWELADYADARNLITSLYGDYSDHPDWFISNYSGDGGCIGATKIREYPQGNEFSIGLVESPEMFYDSNSDGSWNVWGDEGEEEVFFNMEIDDRTFYGAWVSSSSCPAPVPEPSSIILFSLVGAYGLSRRKNEI